MQTVIHIPAGVIRPARTVHYTVGPCQSHEVAGRGGADRAIQTVSVDPRGPKPGPARVEPICNTRVNRSAPPRRRAVFFSDGESPRLLCRDGTTRTLIKEKETE